jgi:hypothetical protein
MSFPIFRNSYEWTTVTTSGENIRATNRKTGETFTGTLAAFDELMNDRLEGIGLVAQSTIPVGIAPSGSVAPNGAITLGTALPVVYSSGIWLALPADAAYTDAPAGTYWCVMSSTTVGTVYDEVLVGVPTVPSAPTAIVDAREATNYTGVTTEVALVTATVAGGLVGANGSIKINFAGSQNSSAGAKTYVVKGGAGTWLSSAATTTASALYDFTVGNRGSAAVNFSTGVNANGLGARGFLATTVDTASNFNVTFNATLAVATDYVLYEHVEVLVAPKL